ncbi:MAG TPA: hypothetical protein P5280_09235, partial [Cyclobacteriaceae bacterium]|nr:hypothetical protein [Cyclobacteriaceae bacterium]
GYLPESSVKRELHFEFEPALGFNIVTQVSSLHLNHPQREADWKPTPHNYATPSHHNYSYRVYMLGVGVASGTGVTLTSGDVCSSFNAATLLSGFVPTVQPKSHQYSKHHAYKTNKVVEPLDFFLLIITHMKSNLFDFTL